MTGPGGSIDPLDLLDLDAELSPAWGTVGAARACLEAAVAYAGGRV